ncbi:MAG: hypothetical protein JOZ19_05185 [Rubrobacter sp.]|nr:hypothetical protein [Rubrobacter sp.]
MLGLPVGGVSGVGSCALGEAAEGVGAGSLVGAAGAGAGSPTGASGTGSGALAGTSHEGGFE